MQSRNIDLSYWKARDNMTESEAIKNINTYIYSELESIPKQILESLKLACFTLREVQQYREVGTVDECREANGKQMPKKVKEDGYFGFVDYVCPTCGHDAGSSGTNYCKNCGQKLRWL